MAFGWEGVKVLLLIVDNHQLFVGEKMKWRNTMKAVLISPLTLVEYVAYVVYVSRFFPNPGEHENYRRLLIIFGVCLTHAVICLVAAIVTGFIIHKKTTVDTLEVFLNACFCAFSSLPLSLFLMLAVFVLSTTLAKWIDTPIYGIVVAIMLITAYIMGIILPSAQSIRMAKIAQNGSDEKLLQQP